LDERHLLFQSNFRTKHPMFKDMPNHFAIKSQVTHKPCAANNQCF
jgi:hypothetical protein